MPTLGPITTQKTDKLGPAGKAGEPKNLEGADAPEIPEGTDRTIPSVRYGNKAQGQTETVIQPEEGVVPVLPLTPDPVPPETTTPPDLSETPVVASIDPATAEIGSADLVMTVRGTGFNPGSTIVFNGGDEPTTYVSDTEVSTGVKPSTATTAGAFPVLVRNAAGTASNSVEFTFTEPTEPAGRSGKK